MSPDPYIYNIRVWFQTKYKQFKQLKQYKHKQKLTNFGDVFIVDRVVCGKSDGNIKDADGQV